VQRFAHAVQPLEFKALSISRHRQNSCNGVRVVRGELRIDAAVMPSSFFAQAI